MLPKKRPRKPKLMELPDLEPNRPVKRKRSVSIKALPHGRAAGGVSAKRQQQTKASQSMLEDAKIVVGLDFGTTFSGFAYASKADPEKIFTFYEWPCQAEAGGRPYCKTQTSLWYPPVPQTTGLGNLKGPDWGWSAQFNHSKAWQERNSNMYRKALLGRPYEPSGVLTCGHFFKEFKLYLAPLELNTAPRCKREQLPEMFPVEKLISDYLRLLSDFIMAELRNKFGTCIRKRNIKWCLTVPTIWTEAMKQTMRDCAEMAGLVRGPRCPPGEDASFQKVDIVLEPEAASIYCLAKLKDFHLRKGSRFLLVDVGGGTVDLIVHEKVDDSGLKVKEVTVSIGDLCGGTFVDRAFMNYLAQKIDCFQEFYVRFPTSILTIKGYWENLKCSFNGEQSKYYLELPAKVANSWEAHQKRTGSWSADTHYDELVISIEDMRSIFDGEVNKILNLITSQLNKVPGIESMLVVGGFAKSPYLMTRIRDKFSLTVHHIISPPDPGSAVCQGAVAWGALGADIIMSRKSKQTYGIDTIREFQLGDPPDSVFEGLNGEKLCKDAFCVFTQIGEDVPVNHPVTSTFGPFQEGEETITFTMYSTQDPQPAFVTDPGVVKVATATYCLPPAAQKMKKPLVNITMYFGRTFIEVSAKPINFEGGVESMFTVVFERDLQ